MSSSETQHWRPERDKLDNSQPASGLSLLLRFQRWQNVVTSCSILCLLAGRTLLLYDPESITRHPSRL